MIVPRGSRHVDQNRPVDHLHRVARDPLLRIMHRVARRDVVPPAVGATSDNIPSEFSRPQRHARVPTGIIDRIDGSLHVEALSTYSCGCPHEAERWESCMSLGP